MSNVICIGQGCVFYEENCWASHVWIVTKMEKGFLWNKTYLYMNRNTIPILKFLNSQDIIDKENLSLKFSSQIAIEKACGLMWK